jgi:hypothetical protein
MPFNVLNEPAGDFQEELKAKRVAPISAGEKLAREAAERAKKPPNGKQNKPPLAQKKAAQEAHEESEAEAHAEGEKKESNLRASIEEELASLGLSPLKKDAAKDEKQEGKKANAKRSSLPQLAHANKGRKESVKTTNSSEHLPNIASGEAHEEKKDVSTANAHSNSKHPVLTAEEIKRRKKLERINAKKTGKLHHGSRSLCALY